MCTLSSGEAILRIDARAQVEIEAVEQRESANYHKAVDAVVHGALKALSVVHQNLCLYMRQVRAVCATVVSVLRIIFEEEVG